MREKAVHAYFTYLCILSPFCPYFNQKRSFNELLELFFHWKWSTSVLKIQTIKQMNLIYLTGLGRFNYFLTTTPVFLPGKSHGRRSMVGYSPWGHIESDTTEWLHFHFLFIIKISKYPSQRNVFGILHYLHVHAKSIQSCPTLCDPIDYSPPGSSVNGILQARILEWLAISFSRGSPWPRDRNPHLLHLLHCQVGSLPLGVLFNLCQNAWHI